MWVPMTAVHGGALWQPRVRASCDYDFIVPADVNDAWYPPAPRVLAAIAEWAPRLHHSPDTTGLALRESMARVFSTPIESIRLGAGSSDLLHHIILACLRPGDEVLILDPTYAEYSRVAEIAGARVERVPSIDSIGPKVRLAAICNPNNPTGTVIPRAQLLRLARSAPRDSILLIDEAYIDFAPEESLFADAPEFENLAIVRTFSKAYALAGLRVAYAAFGERVRALFDARARPPWPVGLLGLKAAEIALEERCDVEQRIAELASLKRDLIDSLCVPAIPSRTHYSLVDLEGTGKTAQEASSAVSACAIFGRDLCGFSTRGLQRFLRITTQSAEANTRIAAA